MTTHQRLLHHSVLRCLLVALLATGSLACQRQIQIRGIYPDAQAIDSSERTDGDIAQLIAPYKAKLDEDMNQVIGRNPAELLKQKPESGLTNWLADLLHEKAEAQYGAPIDFAYQNYGGIRVPSLPKGKITKGHIFELMPFDNRMSILELDGPATFQLISDFARSGGAPVSSALRFKIVDEHPVDIMINGRAFDESRSYRVMMPDYIANGGDNLEFLQGQPRKDLALFIRDAIIEYIQEKQIIESKLDGRIQVL